MFRTTPTSGMHMYCTDTFRGGYYSKSSRVFISCRICMYNNYFCYWITKGVLSHNYPQTKLKNLVHFDRFQLSTVIKDSEFIYKGCVLFHNNVPIFCERNDKKLKFPHYSHLCQKGVKLKYLNVAI